MKVQDAGRPDAPTCTPSDEISVAACTNGADDDCDSFTDCDDSDCAGLQPGECCNGIDDNGNRLIDEFACRCRADAECASGMVCYVGTLDVCGPRCNTLGGNAFCAQALPGTTCSISTGRCQ